MTTTMDSDGFKRSAINWLLANGEHDAMGSSTGSALADLAVSGIDYEASTTPDFGRVMVDPGDSFNEATWGEGFSATVIPVGATTNYNRHYDFVVGDDEMKRILIHQAIRGIVTTDPDATDWAGRVDQREAARLRAARQHQADTARRRAMVEEGEARGLSRDEALAAAGYDATTRTWNETTDR